MNNTLLNETVLKKQQETTAKLNALLAQSADALTCGPTCQKIRTSEELEQNYLNSQTNMLTAPIELENARKQYYTFTKGDGAYNTMLEDDLKKKADMIGKEISAKFLEEVKKANVLNAYYNTDLINSKNTTELYDDYSSKNKHFETVIRNIHGDILTHDRKSYYENQSYEKSDSWYTILIYIYYLLVFVFLLGLIFSPNQLKLMQKIGILFIFIIYPFVMKYISSFMLNLLFSSYSKKADDK